MTAECAELHAEIEGFFIEYISAFARHDAKAISELWDEVSLFPSPDRNFAMQRAEFQAHCSSLMEFYDSRGVIEPKGRLISVQRLFPDVVQARMAYCMMGAAQTVIARWEHVYILRKTNRRWRVSLTLADDEMAAWAGAQEDQ
jgi:hypothetical protein